MGVEPFWGPALRANWAPAVECSKRQPHRCIAAGNRIWPLCTKSTNYSDLTPLNGTLSLSSLPQQRGPQFMQLSLIDPWTEAVAIGSMSPTSSYEFY